MKLRQLLHRLVDDFAGGRQIVLEAWNFGREKNKMSEQMLNNKLNPFSESHNTNVNELELALDVVNGWHAMAEFAAQKCNAVVVVNPEIPESDMGGLDLFLSIMTASGTFAKEFQDDYADVVIDAKESARLDEKTDALIAAVLAFKAYKDTIKRGF